MKLTADPDFRTVVSLAKAVQQVQGRHELTIGSMLLGALVADMQGKLRNGPSVRLHGKELRKIAAEAGLDLERSYAAIENSTMPLAGPLKVALTDHAEDGFDGFFVALLGYGASQDGPEGSGHQKGGEVDTLDDDAYGLILDHASSLAHHLKLEAITPELLAVSALLACDQGKLPHRRGLAIQIMENRANIEAVAEASGWNDLKSLRLRHGLKSPEMTAEFRTALGRAAKSPLPLVTLLNAGISVGSGLRMRRRTAYHEAGHAVVSLTLQPELVVNEVSIIPRDDYLGVTLMDDDSPWWRPPETRERVMGILCVALAGRVSEQARFGHGAADAGASSDLESATSLAWRAITEWGLDDTFGPVALGTISGWNGIRSGWLFDEAQRRLQVLLQEAQAKTEALVGENAETIEAVALELLGKNRISGERVLEIMNTTMDSPGKRPRRSAKNPAS